MACLPAVSARSVSASKPPPSIKPPQMRSSAGAPMVARRSGQQTEKTPASTVPAALEKAMAGARAAVGNASLIYEAVVDQHTSALA